MFQQPIAGRVAPEGAADRPSPSDALADQLAGRTGNTEQHRPSPKGIDPATQKRLVPAVIIAALALWTLCFILSVDDGLEFETAVPSTGTIIVAAILHMPYVAILAFLLAGLRERIGYFFIARDADPKGRLPETIPTVCVQLPMFNEAAVATRIIGAAAAMKWPHDKLEIQVLDDSTEAATRMMVEEFCAAETIRSGVSIIFLHRSDRAGYKAGALESGRHHTEAEYIVIFDADFLPPSDYLTRIIPHFYDAAGAPLDDIALVQAQWGHLNDDESPLTAAQALWVDDHHTLQQSWRSWTLRFVNFTGTAGVWRRSAMERVGGWSSASLVEDCEISFRALFAGYRTKFVKDVVVPAELPQSVAAYRSQQKRWTQGWAQLQRLHLRRLVFDHKMGIRRKSGLLAMVCISWQWPLWFLWIAIFPFLLAKGMSLAALGSAAALTAYLAPPILFALLATLAATHEAKPTYATPTGVPRVSKFRRFFRVIPYLVVSAGMLPHHFCAFIEGLFGPMHAEFERTPKTAQITGLSDQLTGAPVSTHSATKKRVGRPNYILVEALFVAVQTCWTVAFFQSGYLLATLASLWLLFGIATLRFGPALYRYVRMLRPALLQQGGL